MRVIFFISVLGHGRGGHFHSLNHISLELGTAAKIGIVTIGPGRSEILEQNPFFIGHAHFNGYNLVSLAVKLDGWIRRINPDVLHCFDDKAYNLIKFLGLGAKRKIVLNKCGGPNPLTYPKVENLILFSKENEVWFTSNPKFNRTKKYLIPNRVRPISVYTDYPIVKTDAFTFVRITRIGSFHRESLIKSILLIEQISSRVSAQVQLIIIGAIQDENVFLEIQELSIGKPVTFMTDDQYTVEASKMLCLADAVIATGRGVMEAASLGIPVLVPVANSDVPILAHKQNIDRLFETNFSSRSLADENDLQENWGLIVKLINDEAYRKDLKQFIRSIFDEYFNVRNAVTKYLAVYGATLHNTYTVGRFEDLKLRLKTIYSFFRVIFQKSN